MNREQLIEYWTSRLERKKQDLILLEQFREERALERPLSAEEVVAYMNIQRNDERKIEVYQATIDCLKEGLCG